MQKYKIILKMRSVIRPLFKPFVTSLTQQPMRAKNISAEFGKPINVVRMREYINKVCGASLFYEFVFTLFINVMLSI